MRSWRGTPGIVGLFLSSCSFGYEILINETSVGGDGDGDGDGDAPGGALPLGGSNSGDGDGDGDGDNSGGGLASGGNLSASGGAPFGGSDPGGGVGGESPYGEPTGATKDHCDTIPLLAAEPVLDGYVDEGIYLEFVTPVGWRNPDVPLPDGNAALFGAAWRPNGLYYFVVVTDPDRVPAPLPSDGADDWDLWQGDGIEIYVDHDGVFDAPISTYAELGTRQVIVAAPPTDDDENTERAAVRRSDGSEDIYTPYDSANWVSRPIPGGYVVEGFFDAATLNLPDLALMAGNTVGINFGHNVSGPTATDGNRLSQYFMKIREPILGDDNDYPFRNEATFCESLLIVE